MSIPRAIEEVAEVEFLERMISAMWNDDIASVFMILILGYFIFALVNVNSKNPKIQVAVQNAASAMTSIGILGTFSGIFIGLLDFEVANISQSVDELLNGLKIAFGSSILGLAGALIFRIVRPFLQKETLDEDAGVEEIVNSITSLEEQIVRSFTRAENFAQGKFERAETRQAANHERLLTALNNMTQSQSAHFLQVIEILQGLAQNFTEGVMEQLQQAIADFNQNLTEQFGENFAQLNEAVGQLLQWQENYREELQELQQAYQQTVVTLTAVVTAVEQVAESTQSIPDAMDRLNEVYGTLTERTDQLEARLQAFGAMAEQAQNAFPTIENNLNTITQGMADAAQTQNDALEQQQAAYVQMTENIQSTIQQQTDQHGQMVEGMQNAFNTTIGNATEALTNAVNDLDTAMQEEIGRIVTAMAENLSGITQQFVRDYEPMVDAMNQVAQAARQQQGLDDA